MAQIAVRVLKEHWNLIAESISDANVGRLNTALWSKEVYNRADREAINAKTTPREKMNEMLLALEKKVMLKATAFDKFLEALRDSEFDDLADTLERTRKDELAKGWL